MTRLVIAGAAGRMGRTLIRYAATFEELRIVGALEKAGDPALGQDAGILAGVGPMGLIILDDPRTLPAADALIDFTFHSAAPAHAALAAERRLALILGTTGLAADEEAAVRTAAKRIPVVWAPNMSLGVNVLFALVRRAAETLGLRYDVEVTEAHHRHKKDAPSGTALRLAREVAEARGQAFDRVAVYGRKGLTGERASGEIAIHALRMGDIIGDHTVSFAVDGERLDLSHRATSRDAFAMGALRAAAWAAGRQPGLYDMQDVLGL